MPESQRYSAYDDFAWVYNKHWGGQFTPSALPVVTDRAFPRVRPGARVLDLCCGTGQLAREMSELGYSVTGIDGSEEMLRYARKNAPSAEFILDDARTFRLTNSFDLVVSMFDSLNHVMTIAELSDVFRNVHDCLKPNGLFLFDMNTEAGFLANWHGYYGFVEDDHVCVFPNSYDSTTRVGKFDMTMFRLQDGNWKRSDFVLTERCYSADELLSALQSSGLSNVQTFSFERQAGFGPLGPQSRRAFFLCERGQD
jgi:SAM-dependent methyltransferase